MLEEDRTVDDASAAEESASAAAVDGFEFLLFLILLLVLMQSQDSFNPHFKLLNKEMETIKSFLNMFTTTANGFKTLVAGPELQ